MALSSTITTDNITETNEFRTGVGAHWTFLSDTRRVIQKDLDIVEYTDPVHNPMIPHTIVLEPGLIIYKIYMGYWFFGRATMEDLRQDLRAVLKKCRTDWDITTPELKAAWQEGIDLKKKILGSLVTKTLNLQGVVNSLTQNLFLKSYRKELFYPYGKSYAQTIGERE